MSYTTFIEDDFYRLFDAVKIHREEQIMPDRIVDEKSVCHICKALMTKAERCQK